MADGWEVKDDQSATSGDGLRQSDLQISEVALTTTAGATTGKADMKHKMGLLSGTIPAATLADDVITYDGNTYNASATGEKWTRLTATTVTWNASTTFSASTNKPYHDTTQKVLYYIAKPNDTTISISTTAGTNLYAWSVSGTSTTVSAASKYQTFTIATPDYTNAFNKKIWEFSFSGTGQQWVAPAAGSYKMECWGAQGGNANATWTGGLGGYVAGTIIVSGLPTWYVVVGGQGATNSSHSGVVVSTSAGYNGGGASMSPSGYYSTNIAAGGGGATHIATASGVLSSLASNQSAVLIVAGGGGGGNYAHYADNNYYHSKGGTGGGNTGGSTTGGVSTGNGVNSPGGGQTQATSVQGGEGVYKAMAVAGTFGQGGLYTVNATNSGGGGGWYGGVGSRNWAGSGGSGHIGTGVTLVANQNGQQSGNGKAVITYTP